MNTYYRNEYIPGTWVTDGCELLYGCSELNLTLQGLLTIKRSLHPSPLTVPIYSGVEQGSSPESKPLYIRAEFKPRSPHTHYPGHLVDFSPGKFAPTSSHTHTLTTAFSVLPEWACRASRPMTKKTFSVKLLKFLCLQISRRGSTLLTCFSKTQLDTWAPGASLRLLRYSDIDPN